MDPSSFEELTKALAANTSRRQALKALAATTAGGLLSLGGLGTVFGAPKCHRNGLGCDTNSQCCSGYCANGKCTCPPLPACTDTCPCPSGQTCYNGTCATVNAIYCDCNDGLQVICSPVSCPDAGPVCQQVCANYGGSWGWGCSGTC